MEDRMNAGRAGADVSKAPQAGNRVFSHRRKNNSWRNLTGFRYAHRGYFEQPNTASRYPKNELSTPLWRDDVRRIGKTGGLLIPENSMAAFERAVQYGFGSELDVHLAKDGSLPVVHDSNLLRMTGREGDVEQLTREELDRYTLLGTDQKIPELEEVLKLYTSREAATTREREAACLRPWLLPRRASAVKKAFRKAGESPDGEALCLPLIIELKATDQTCSSLCEKVMELIDRFPSLNYCVESFDPRSVLWFRKNRPDVLYGQLTENFTKSRSAVRDWGRISTFGMWCGATNLRTHPDFIACKYADRRNPAIRLSYLLGVRQVSWTLHSQEELDIVEHEGGVGIFERFLPDGNGWGDI